MAGRFVAGGEIGVSSLMRVLYVYRTHKSPSADEALIPHVYARPVVVEVLVRVKALAFREAEGGYSVVVPEIDGCVTQGETIEEVEHMVRELAETLLDDMHHNEKRETATKLLTEPRLQMRSSHRLGR